MLQATLANLQRSKNAKEYRADQFLPQWGLAKPQGPMSGEDMLRQVKQLNRSLGGG